MKKKRNPANTVEIVEKKLKEEYPNAEIERVDSGKKSKQNKGYDILVTKRGGKKITIEVKGTEKETKKISIPDAFETEFKIKPESIKFVADFLYVVTFLKKKKMIYKIPKCVIDKYSSKHRIVKHVKFASALKTELNKDYKKYLV